MTQVLTDAPAPADWRVDLTDGGVLVEDMPDGVYFADPVPGGSLSYSGAKRLLPVLGGCPALFEWERRHGRRGSRAFDLGHAAHREVLGAGAEIAVLDLVKDGEVLNSWRTKAAQEFAKDARARGAVPLLAEEAAAVRGMADAIRRHPLASRLYDPARGRAEVAAFARCPDTGVAQRCRIDWLPTVTGFEQLRVPDYKTITCASPDAIRRAVERYAYDLQHATYTTVLEQVGAFDPTSDAFLFVFQETTPPYLVTVVQLDPDDVTAARARWREALELYALCERTGHWPGYADGRIPLIKLRPWAHTPYDGEDDDDDR